MDLSIVRSETITSGRLANGQGSEAVELLLTFESQDGAIIVARRDTGKTIVTVPLAGVSAILANRVIGAEQPPIEVPGELWPSPADDPESIQDAHLVLMIEDHGGGSYSLDIFDASTNGHVVSIALPGIAAAFHYQVKLLNLETSANNGSGP